MLVVQIFNTIMLLATGFSCYGLGKLSQDRKILKLLGQMLEEDEVYLRSDKSGMSYEEREEALTALKAKGDIYNRLLAHF